MFNNKCKNSLCLTSLAAVVGLVAIGLVTTPANAQIKYSAPTISGRWGGSVVSATGVSFFNNTIRPLGVTSALPIAGTIFNPTVNRAPLDGTQVPLAMFPPMAGSNIVNNTVINTTVRRAPLDGTQVPLSFTIPNVNSGFFSNNTVIDTTVRRAPLNGTQVPLTMKR